MRFRFIEQHAASYPVRLMCRVLEVSASGSYVRRTRPESQRASDNRRLLAEVRRLQSQHHGRYKGYYNLARIHSAIGYLTPEQAERKAS